MSEYGDGPVMSDIHLGLKLLNAARSAGLNTSKLPEAHIMRLLHVAKTCVDLDAGREISEEAIKTATNVSGEKLNELMEEAEDLGGGRREGEFAVNGFFDDNTVALTIPESDNVYGLDPGTAADIGLGLVAAAIAVSDHNKHPINLKPQKIVVERISKGAPPEDLDAQEGENLAVVAKEGQIYIHWKGEWVRLEPKTAEGLGKALLTQFYVLKKMPTKDRLH